MVSQLRVFTINRGKMDEFITAWLDGVYPLRLKHGFTIEDAWVTRERNEFVWVLSYAGPEDWESKDAAYYASQERIGLDPDPRQYIAKSKNRFITSVLAGAKPKVS